MGKILSIDLAYRRVRDLGICLIEERKGKVASVSFVDPEKELGFEHPPSAEELAEVINNFCHQKKIRVLLLDGPQGWKSQTNGLNHSRICERLLNTPGKTGTRNRAKPKNYLPFIRFSIEVFAHLLRMKGILVQKSLITMPRNGFLLVESFPMSAWRKLCIVPLPAKRKAQQSHMICRLRLLQRLFGFRAPRMPNHDELQALAAGLAGVAILAGHTDGYIAEGAPPKRVGGVIVEGFIVNPRIGENAWQ